MTPHHDLSEILSEWRREPGDSVQARLIAGRDGAAAVQLRIDMGLLQMQLSGRPDGATPHGCESLLAYHRQRLRAHRREHGSDTGFVVAHEDCGELHRESIQYYHRRICLLEVGEYARAESDADHNLEILDLLRAFAQRREDWRGIDQFRPYMMSHRAMARAMALAHKGQLSEALRAIDEGMAAIREVLREQGRSDRLEDSNELDFLRGLKGRIRRGQPGQLRDRLERALERALAREDYEEAAQIRDRLREL